MGLRPRRLTLQRTPRRRVALYLVIRQILVKTRAKSGPHLLQFIAFRPIRQSRSREEPSWINLERFEHFAGHKPSPCWQFRWNSYLTSLLAVCQTTPVALALFQV